jgi:hypothetical protein
LKCESKAPFLISSTYGASVWAAIIFPCFLCHGLHDLHDHGHARVLDEVQLSFCLSWFIRASESNEQYRTATYMHYSQYQSAQSASCDFKHLCAKTKALLMSQMFMWDCVKCGTVPTLSVSTAAKQSNIFRVLS